MCCREGGWGGGGVHFFCSLPLLLNAKGKVGGTQRVAEHYSHVVCISEDRVSGTRTEWVVRREAERIQDIWISDISDMGEDIKLCNEKDQYTCDICSLVHTC